MCTCKLNSVKLNILRLPISTSICIHTDSVQAIELINEYTQTAERSLKNYHDSFSSHSSIIEIKNNNQSLSPKDELFKGKYLIRLKVRIKTDVCYLCIKVYFKTYSAHVWGLVR